MKKQNRPCRRAAAGGLFYSSPARSACQLPGLILALAFASVDLPAQTNQVDLTQIPLEKLMTFDVVYSASKFEQKTTDAPSSVTIITAAEIKAYGYRTLADVLGSVQGFNISYDRNYAFLGTRGVSLGDFNDRVLLLVDGHRVNNDFNDGAFIDTAFILDIDLVDRVEIIRGPSAVLYGNNAFFGVINVVTRQGAQLNGVEASAEYGSFDTGKARVSYGKQFTNGVQMLFSGTYYDSGGQNRLFYKEFNTPAQNNGVAQDLDGDAFSSFFSSLSYKDFTLEGAFIQRVKANPTAQYLTTFDDPRLRTVDEQGYTALKYAHSFEHAVHVTAQVYGDGYSHQIGYPQLTNAVSSRLSTETDLGEWWGAELQLNKKLWDRDVITLGGEYRDDFLQDSRVVVDGQPTEGSDTRTNRQSYGVYAQGDFELLTTNLHLNAGVRYDEYGDFEPTVNPRLALIYHPWEKSTFKAIYGTAFRAPSFYEIAASDHALNPEKIASYEVVYEQEFAGHLRSSLSGYYNKMDDLLVFSSGSFTNFNADTRGLELALEGFWASGIRGRASYSLQNTRNSTVGWAMPDSPDQLFKFNVSVPLVKDKISAGLEFQYDTARQSLHNTTDAAGQPITVQGEEAGGFGLLNLTLLGTNILSRHLEFSASVYNLLDRRYSDPASQFHVQDLIEQDGRSFRVKLTYRY